MRTSTKGLAVAAVLILSCRGADNAEIPEKAAGQPPALHVEDYAGPSLQFT
jgi:hypothetical protein